MLLDIYWNTTYIFLKWSYCKSIFKIIFNIIHTNRETQISRFKNNHQSTSGVFLYMFFPLKVAQVIKLTPVYWFKDFLAPWNNTSDLNCIYSWVRTAQCTHCVSLTKTNHLMLYGEKTRCFSWQPHTQYINTLRKHNVEFLYVEPVCTYSKDCVLKC